MRRLRHRRFFEEPLLNQGQVSLDCESSCVIMGFQFQLTGQISDIPDIVLLECSYGGAVAHGRFRGSTRGERE